MYEFPVGDAGTESLLSGIVELRSGEMDDDTEVRPAREAVLRHAPKWLASAALRPPISKPPASDAGNRSGLASSLGNQAFILAELGSHEEALRLFAEARRLHEETGNVPGVILCLKNEAIARHKTGDLVGALELFRQEAEMLRRLPQS